MGGIEKPQFDFVKKVLEENHGVKWTFVFIHQPLWLNDNAGYWKDVEELLQDRNYTVFAGHKHHYVKSERNDRKYFILATTGGISELRGPSFGEFDHFVWVTMTDEEPVIANLLLEAIWNEDVTTKGLTDMISAERITIEPVFEENYFEQGEFKVKITNDANYPMWTVLRFGKSQYLIPEIIEYQKTIPPNSVEQVDITMSSRIRLNIGDIEPIPLFTWFVYRYEDGREIKLDEKFALVPVKKDFIRSSEGEVVVDGNLDDWSGLPFRGNIRSTLTNNVQDYNGDYDASFEFNVMQDEDFLYLGMAVWDDELITRRRGTVWDQDAVLINLDARPVHISANGRGNNRFNDFVYLFFSPSTTSNQSPQIYQEERLPEGTRLATMKSVQGFDMELAIPMAYLNSNGGIDWDAIRLNICYFDKDNNSPRTGIWWQPEWSSSKNFIGSGTLFKTSAD
jgi:hypothetical protein